MLTTRLIASGFSTGQAQAIVGDAGLSLTAAGTNQATALQLVSPVNIFGTVAAGTGCILPTNPSPGDTVSIFNGGANPLTIYPVSGGYLNNQAANAPLTLAVQSHVVLQCVAKGGNKWAAPTLAGPSIIIGADVALNVVSTDTTQSAGVAFAVSNSASPSGGMSFIPASTSGAWNPVVSSGDSVIFANQGTIGSGTLALTTWASTGCGIRITPTQLLFTSNTGAYISGPSSGGAYNSLTVNGSRTDGGALMTISNSNTTSAPAALMAFSAANGAYYGYAGMGGTSGIFLVAQDASSSVVLGTNNITRFTITSAGITTVNAVAASQASLGVAASTGSAAGYAIDLLGNTGTNNPSQIRWVSNSYSTAYASAYADAANGLVLNTFVGTLQLQYNGTTYAYLNSGGQMVWYSGVSGSYVTTAAYAASDTGFVFHNATSGRTTYLTQNTTGGFGFYDTGGGNWIFYTTTAAPLQMVVPGSMLIGSKNTQAANGSVQLPNGTIMQWGTATTSGSGSVAITFPQTFPTGCYSVTVTGKATSGQTWCFITNTPSATGVTVYCNNSSTAAAVSAPFYWVAIGY